MNLFPFFIFFIILFYSLILFILFRQLFFALTTFFGAPFVATPEKKIEKILKLLDLKPGEVFYDLGSGRGDIIIKAAKNYKVKAIGIEINPFLVRASQNRIKKLGLKSAKVYFGNFFKKDLSDANAVFVYLLQPTLYRLEKKFLEELKPKTRIISLSFTFQRIPFLLTDSEFPEIKLYQIPEKK